ncbi:unnamed protein product [Paramecium pentaurelia]|uniref:Transmembrane protein n=1 Tax=Paramecium pentaurelia TaxID=43138 RepID=A0A8S1VSP7_9CILI|nr:unnamed protein product [Paramecium pentaurelia]
MFRELVSIILILFISDIQITNQSCLNSCYRIKQIVRGNCQNVLNQKNGNLISEKNKQYFSANHWFLRDSIYKIFGGFGYQICFKGQSMQVDLKQKYELNTLNFGYGIQIIGLYNKSVYQILKHRNIIYESSLSCSVVTIKFQNQLVESFRINNDDSNINKQIIKIMLTIRNYMCQKLKLTLNSNELQVDIYSSKILSYLQI